MRHAIHQRGRRVGDDREWGKSIWHGLDGEGAPTDSGVGHFKGLSWVAMRGWTFMLLSRSFCHFGRWVCYVTFFVIVAGWARQLGGRDRFKVLC